MHRLKREKLDHLVLRENLAVVAGIPAKEKKIVEKRLGNIPLLTEFTDKRGAITLGVGFTLRIDNHREMPVLRRRRAKRLEKLYVLEGVLHMVVAADDVRNTLVDVINHVRQMENGRPIAADDGEVLDILGLLRHVTLHDVVKFDGAFLRHAEHHDFAGFAVTGGAFALVCLPLGKKLFNALKMAFHVLGLVELRLVIVEPEPFHALEKRLDGLGRRTLEVGILNTKEELAAGMTGEQPVVDGCADVADVNLPSR